ncbi:hypothetical protein KKC08_02715 [Patescibacteria group bacterium]|nr:hypothetical protein [Patescibacteria group bacterium]MCG2702733.1 hypothetical protein [Candidatus Parcubacteria bacterium]MBU4265433.1 hypothetical protein [Patescibacteria group bacterium]MBU4390483.1 hypothetical protein [Patescibacteria group bacterium]MBU4397050.1 hypothetical protein [Patescibacteria group bacterium]
MQKYRFPTLSSILKVKIGTKYVWEKRVAQQNSLIHLLENMYGIKLNFRAFSFYPNYLYFGMPITSHPNIKKAKLLWQKIDKVFEKNRWKTHSAYKYVDPNLDVPKDFDSFEDLGFGHVQLLLSELVLLDFNYPSHGVGLETNLSLLQPLIGFSKNSISRMVKGRPGSLILKYKTEEELLKILCQISKRKSYRKEPFYIKKCPNHPLKAVFKGKTCLNCLFKNNLH